MDTSALTKLLISEPETTELRTWLTAQSGQGEDAATSTLGRVELMRVVARYGQPGQTERARYLLDGLDILPLTEPVIGLAETIGPATPTFSRRDSPRGRSPDQAGTDSLRHLRPPIVERMP